MKSTRIAKRIFATMMMVALLLPSVASAHSVSPEDAAHSIYGNEFNNEKDKENLPKSSDGDVSMGTTELATDSTAGKITVRLPLLYKGSTNVRGSLSLFEIRATIEDTTKWPFTANENTVLRLSDIQREEPNNYKDPKDYIEFTFDVDPETLNGLYSIKFEVRHLDIFQDPHFDTPAKSSLLAYVKVTKGKEPPEETTPPPSATAKPVSKPMLMLESFSTDPDPVLASNEFDLTLVFKNTHPDRDIQNVTGKIAEAENMALPASGSSTFYIDNVKAGASTQVTIRMKTDANAGVKPTKFSLTMNYEDTDNNPIEAKEEFVMPVFQEVKLECDEPRYDYSFTKGGSSYIYMNIYNKGKSTIYNVMVRLESAYVQLEENYFAGNMEMGTTRSLDTLIIERTGMGENFSTDDGGNMGMGSMVRSSGGMAISVAMPDIAVDGGGGMAIPGDYDDPYGNMAAPDGFSGQVPDAKLIVTYEDKDGQEFREEVALSLNIIAEDTGAWIDDPGMYEDPGLPTDTGFWKQWMTYAAIGVGVVAIIVIIAVTRSRRRKKDLDDEMV